MAQTQSEAEEVTEITDHQPELTALRDNLIRYEIASASERQARDQLVATWKDILHAALKTTDGSGIVLVHKVIDSMDEFLNRAGGRRK